MVKNRYGITIREKGKRVFLTGKFPTKREAQNIVTAVRKLKRVKQLNINPRVAALKNLIKNKKRRK